MKLYTALIATLLLATTACTHNDGGEKILYGQWQLVSIEAQGNVEAPTVPEGCVVYWKFQNTTIGMTAVHPNHELSNCFGNFRLTDNTLFLDFPDDTDYGWPMFGLPRQCEMQLASHSSKSLTLIYNPIPDGQIIYTFRKW